MGLMGVQRLAAGSEASRRRRLRVLMGSVLLCIMFLALKWRGAGCIRWPALPLAAPPAGGCTGAGNTAALQQLLLRVQQRPAQKAIERRWGLQSAGVLQPPPVESLRIPRILHHVHIPSIEAYLNVAQQYSGTVREEWGASCARMHPAWRYVFWDLDSAMQLLREHYPQYADMFAELPHAINKSDFLRFVIMHAFGGLYLDTDVECWRAADSFLADADVVLQGFWEQGKPADLFARVTTASGIFASVPGHPLWEAAMRRSQYNWQHVVSTCEYKNINDLAGERAMEPCLYDLPGIEYRPASAFPGFKPGRRGQPDTVKVPAHARYSGECRSVTGTVAVYSRARFFDSCDQFEEESEERCIARLERQHAAGAAALDVRAGLHRRSRTWKPGSLHSSNQTVWAGRKRAMSRRERQALKTEGFASFMPPHCREQQAELSGAKPTAQHDRWVESDAHQRR